MIKNIESTFIVRRKNELLFILFFAVFSVSYYDGVLEKGPLSMHLWRQADCLSLTSNYANGANLLEPEIHFQGSDWFSSGKSAGEFPALYYIVGKIWSLTGESYLAYRLCYLLILFAGSFALFKSLLFIFNDGFWAIFIPLLLFTSPVYTFYGISFLTDVPAFSFVLIALYFLLQYHRKNSSTWFYLSMAFFAFAGLVKISSMIAFVFMFFMLILEFFKIKTLDKKFFFRIKTYELLSFFSVILIVLSWYIYGYYYNGVHGFKYTINDVFLPRKMNAQQIEDLVNGIKNLTSRVFFNRSIIYGLMLVAAVNLFLRKKIPILAYLSNVMLLLGAGIYFVLWLPIMRDHDYYFVPLLILFIGILSPFLWYIKISFPIRFNDFRIKSLMSIVLVFNFIYCLSVVKVMTSKGQAYKKYHNSFFMQKITWANQVNQLAKKNEEMRPYLRTIGVPKEAKVITLPDHTPNVTLFLLGHKGWSDFYPIRSATDMDARIEKGAKYLIVSNKSILEQEFMKPFLSNQIGSYEGISIFKLSK